MSRCGSFGRKLRAVCLLVIVGAIAGQICSHAWGGTIYSTSFDNPPFSSWAGVDGWYSTDPSDGVVGTSSPGVVGIGGLGGSKPSGSFAAAGRDFFVDPVGSKQPIVKLRTDIGILASTNANHDIFALALYNSAGTYLCALYFDEGTGSILFDNGDGNTQLMPVYFVPGYYFQIELTVDFSTSLASATISTSNGWHSDLFKDRKLNKSGSALNLGTFEYLWLPTNPSSPGNDAMLVDDLSIEASPAPSLILSKGAVHHVSGPNFIVRGGQAAEDNVRVEWRTKKHHQWTAVRGSSTSWLVPVRQLVKGRNLVDIRLLNANDAVIDQKRVVIIRK